MSETFSGVIDLVKALALHVMEWSWLMGRSHSVNVLKTK